MPIKRITPRSDFQRFVKQRIATIEKVIIRNLIYLGEECVNKAREDGNYMDRSGNLRGSIGYVIVVNGEVEQLSGFSKSYGKQEGVGAKEGENFAKSLAMKYQTGYALIVVAGMNYAACVEALDNYVVLSSAELYAKKKLPVIMRKLKTV